MCWPSGSHGCSSRQIQGWPSQGRTLSRPRSRWSACPGTCRPRPCVKAAKRSADGQANHRPRAGHPATQLRPSRQLSTQTRCTEPGSGPAGQAPGLLRNRRSIGDTHAATAPEWQNSASPGAPSPQQAHEPSTSPVWPHRRSPGACRVRCGAEGGVCHRAEPGRRRAGSAERAVALRERAGLWVALEVVRMQQHRGSSEICLRPVSGQKPKQNFRFVLTDEEIARG